MNSENPTTSDVELTEEEMNESSAQLGLVAAAVATGLVVGFGVNMAMEWYENRKSKKAAKTEV